MSKRRKNVWLGRIAVGGWLLALSIAGCGDDAGGPPGSELGGDGGEPSPSSAGRGHGGAGGANHGGAGVANHGGAGVANPGGAGAENQSGADSGGEPGSAGTNPQPEGGSSGVAGNSAGSGGTSDAAGAAGAAGMENGGRMPFAPVGGSSGTGGSKASGGSAGTAGSAGSGGASGGSGGSAGIAGTGGTAGTAGTGGTAGTAGTAGTGGTASGCPSTLCSKAFSEENCGAQCGPILSESCLECEAENCAQFSQNCAQAIGLAADGPGEGVARSALCTELVDCMHRTRCVDFDEGNPLACYCGDASEEECEAGDARGACREEYVRAGETELFATLAIRIDDGQSALYYAVYRMSCDSLACTAECFPDPG
jgi:hypothetical protein